jgi:hypothetical protein
MIHIPGAAAAVFLSGNPIRKIANFTAEYGGLESRRTDCGWWAAVRIPDRISTPGF